VPESEVMQTLMPGRTQLARRPGIKGDVMVIAVMGEEGELRHPEHEVQAENVAVEGDRPIKVADVQVYVSDVHLPTPCECLRG
jgi:hypothetical protein